jgi:cytochrome c-type biogenesis protein CcsB
MDNSAPFTGDLVYYFSATFLYIAAAILYGVNFFFKKKLNMFGRIAAFIGIAIQMVGMIIRWVTTGHPIFISLYEMLLWFAWGAILIMLIAELKFKYKDLGFFVLPFVVIIMGIVLLMPVKGSGTVVPALQSVWLYIHVAVAIVSYAAFLIGFAAAIMYFIKKNVKPSWFAFWISIFTAVMLFLINRGEIITGRSLNIYLRSEGHPFLAEAFKDVGLILFISFLLFVLSSIVHFTVSLENKKKEVREALISIGKIIFSSGAFGLLAGLLLLILHLAKHQTLKVTSQPAILAFLLSAFIITSFCVLLVYKYKTFQDRLPGEELLDNLQYYSITFGFPFLTLTIITGAFWANKAWGSYWGNDPKEWAAAVTWIVYAAYLHMRITRGWSGVKAAVILVLGFAAVIFTLLGVTYLAPGGLHSYI